MKTYKTVILPVVLYVCKTWSLTLMEEHRSRLFKNKALRNGKYYVTGKTAYLGAP
jgi:hypothetical protein